jgi:hypothetical protein
MADGKPDGSIISDQVIGNDVDAIVGEAIEKAKETAKTF